MRDFKDLKIAVAGTGYVGLSIATLLSQHHKVMAVDIVPEKVELINSKKSPIQDEYIEKYLAEKELDLTATLDAKEAYSDADFVVIAAPTNYDSKKNFFDTSAVEAVIKLVISKQLNCFCLGKAHEQGINVFLDCTFLKQFSKSVCSFYQTSIIYIRANDNTARIQVVIQCLALTQELRAEDNVVAVIFFTDARGEANRNRRLDYHNCFRVILKGRYEAEKNAVIISLEKDEREC